MLQLSKWDLDVETNDGEEYTSLVRAVRRNHQRFKLLFVSCSPSQGEKVRHDLMADIPAKKYELLDIKESINNLYEAINNIPNLSELDVLFIRGLEYSIFEYEDQEFGDISKRSQSKVYGGSWAGVPPVLAKLNMQRELFRDQFPHICFVFLLPHFAVDYFIRRAPDFYDWKSGIYRIETDTKDLKLQLSKVSDSDNYGKYAELTNEQKLAKITEIRSCLYETKDAKLKCKLLYHLGLIYLSCNLYLPALDSFDCTLQFNSDKDEFWKNRGLVLSNLGRYTEAIYNYDLSLKIKPDSSDAWFKRGQALYGLDRYNEEIDNYDRCLQLNPNAAGAWNNRGTTLFILGRYEEAISSHDRALQILPDSASAWSNRGNSLLKLGRYEEAITNYDRALQIYPNFLDAWCNRGVALVALGMYAEAIKSHNLALQINPSSANTWNHRGNLLHDLGLYEKAILDYDSAIRINPKNADAWNNRGNSLCCLGRYEESLFNHDHALQVNPDHNVALYNRAMVINYMIENWKDKASTDFNQGNYSDSLKLLQKTFNIIQKEQLNNASDLIQSFLDEQLLPKFQQPAVRDILPQILTIYTTAQVLPELAVALTRNLKAIQSPTISDYTAAKWLKMWQELGKPHPELALALRMLEAGIKYQQNPTDDRVFLSLPQEMRPLLREALGLKDD